MQLDHIGIAQKDASTLSRLFHDLRLPAFEGAEVLDKQGVQASFSNLEGVTIEMVCPTNEESPIAKFLATRGAGIHHLAFLVDDIAAERTRLMGLGYKPLGEKPTLGAKGKWVQFFHPKDTGGVLIELCQKSESQI